MTHSESLSAADSPPAMYRSATLAIVVSRISMNVGTTTTTATTQWLIAGRPTAAGVDATRLMMLPRRRAEVLPEGSARSTRPRAAGRREWRRVTGGLAVVPDFGAQAPGDQVAHDGEQHGRREPEEHE